MKDLIPLENPNTATLFKPGGLDSILEKVEAEALSLVPDLTTAKGRDAIASQAARVARTKTYLDDLGKEYVAELKALPKAIDAQRKLMRDRLDALKTKVRAPLDAWERDRADERAAIEHRISQIRSINFGATPPSADVIRERIKTLETMEIGPDFKDQQEQARQARDATCYALERMAKDAEAREQAEEEERAAWKAKKDEEIRAAVDAKTADLRATLAEELDRVKKLDEAKAAEPEVAPPDRTHAARVENEAALALEIEIGLTRSEAQDIIAMIAAGRVPHVSIHY